MSSSAIGFALTVVLSGLTACAHGKTADSRPDRHSPLLEIRSARDDSVNNHVRMETAGLRNSAERKGAVYVSASPIVSDEDVEDIRMEWTDIGLQLVVRFTPDAAFRLVESTKAPSGLQLAVLVDSRLANVVPIHSPMAAGRRVYIGLEVPDDVARELAAKIAERWPQ